MMKNLALLKKQEHETPDILVIFNFTIKQVELIFLP